MDFGRVFGRQCGREEHPEQRGAALDRVVRREGPFGAVRQPGGEAARQERPEAAQQGLQRRDVGGPGEGE